MSRIRFGENVTEAIERKISAADFLMESSRGRLVVLDHVPVAGIQLKVEIGEYLDFIAGIPEAERPDTADIVPYQNDRFQIVINAPVVLRAGQTFINGRKVVLI